jgi:thiamine pyrophosphate-dependent acetolactate synthase large subunit-like protein
VPGLRLVVVAGPNAPVDPVRRFAESTGLGVVNTWGLKGLFRWDSPFHLGTAGLQERDFELAGVLDADIVLGIGLDPDESPPELLGALVEVDESDLAVLASRLGRARPAPDRPRLYTELAAVVGPLYAATTAPLNPARATADLAAALPPGGLVTADPGPAGLWVARTFSTTELGSVRVPARRSSAAALTIATEAARAGRPVIAVTTAPVDDATAAAIEAARAEHLSLVVDVWAADAPPLSSAEHISRLSESAAAGGVQVIEVPVDLTHTRLLVDVAGPVRAWQQAGA